MEVLNAEVTLLCINSLANCLDYADVISARQAGVCFRDPYGSNSQLYQTWKCNTEEVVISICEDASTSTSVIFLTEKNAKTAMLLSSPLPSATTWKTMVLTTLSIAPILYPILLMDGSFVLDGNKITTTNSNSKGDNRGIRLQLCFKLDHFCFRS
jgi:hypothetical protein